MPNTTQPNTETETDFTEIEQKIAALAAHLDTDADYIDQSDYDDMVFEADGDEYLVCTDDDADERAGETIRESLWAFSPWFIIEHTDLPNDASDMIAGFCAEKCEGANDTIEGMITDLGEFIEDAICADGRGRFLSSYDGEENEENGFYIYQV